MARRAVIIGTGAGGLTAAAALAQRGYEVVALERGKQLGGFLNPFARKHFHFDPGLHYIGQCGEGESVDRVLGAIGLDAPSAFVAMDRDRFDVLRFPGFEMKICAGLDAYEARLSDAFPEDRRDIARYFAVLRFAASIIAARVPRGLSTWRALASALHLRGTWAEMLDKMIENPRVRAVLAGQCGDIGLPPSRMPAVLGLGLTLHFAEGGYFPRGGSGALRDRLVESARAHGAVFHRRAEVTKIHVERGAVASVEVASGERFEADVVVSAIDPVLTYGSLLDAAHVPAKLREKVRRTEPSVATLCVFLGMRRDLRKHGLGAFNVWDYPSWDLEALYGGVPDGAMPEDWSFFLSPNSLKDDTGGMAPAGSSTLEIVTLASHAPFAQWAGQKSFKRSEGYLELKARAADSVIASVERRWPGLIGDVEVQDIATPVTVAHYVNTPSGSIYGPASTPEQFGLNRFKAATPIRGLALAGAGTLGPGVATCLASGLLAAKVARRVERRWFGLRAAPERPRTTSPNPRPRGALDAALDPQLEG